MIMSSFDNDNLTTDACPNYPEEKDENVTSKSDVNDSPPRFPDKEETDETVYEEVETKKKHKSKTKKINNQGYFSLLSSFMHLT